MFFSVRLNHHKNIAWCLHLKPLLESFSRDGYPDVFFFSSFSYSEEIYEKIKQKLNTPVIVIFEENHYRVRNVPKQLEKKQQSECTENVNENEMNNLLGWLEKNQLTAYYNQQRDKTTIAILIGLFALSRCNLGSLLSRFTFLSKRTIHF